jgi:paraquat-inducible protein A
MRRAFPLILFAATFSLALGIVLPLIRVDRLFVFSDQPSLVAMIAGLWTEGDWLLAGIIALFSIIFPCVKLGLLHIVAYGGEESNLSVPGWFTGMANWSMLDVVLVALVIFAAKTSGLGTAFTMPGLWFFASSAVLTAAASQVAKRFNRPA